MFLCVRRLCARVFLGRTSLRPSLRDNIINLYASDFPPPRKSGTAGGAEIHGLHDTHTVMHMYTIMRACIYTACNIHLLEILDTYTHTHCAPSACTMDSSFKGTKVIIPKDNDIIAEDDFLMG